MTAGALAFLLVPAAASAQAPSPARETATLAGVVLDATTGLPVPGAVVSVFGHSQAFLVGAQGTFALPGVPTGLQVVLVESLGYQDLYRTVTIGPQLERLELRLQPDPVLLEGITVMSDRFRARRNSVPVSVQVYGTDRLLRTAAWDARDFLQREAFLTMVPCSGRGMSDECVYVRGGVARPQVFIDEMPAIAGLYELGTYPAHQLYLIEVYGRGRQIRAYTHQFVERVGRRPQQLLPVFIW
ncbi:MAG: carboxypeptidase-like regulatory domain-containing protein [Gemmatimonadetes bacterium]|nr:carboxypeptidase-like regulatory domain-containing protein [Gemmatimonadota bacterium]